MSDTPPSGERSIGGSVPNMGRGVFQRVRSAVGGGRSASASASLKFDIGGLTKFHDEVKKIQTSIKDLDDKFKKLATAPKNFANELERVNKQLVDMNRNIGSTKNLQLTAGNGVSAGQAGGMSPQATGGGAALGGANKSAAGADIGAAIGNAVSKAVAMQFDRFQSGAEAGKSADVYLSRLAVSTGRTGRQEVQGIGRKAPFQGTLGEVSQTMYELSQRGYVVGGQGIGGQRGQAAAQSIGMLQQLSPGMGSAEAGNIVMNQAANVSAERQAVPLMGQAAMAYTPEGKLKPLKQRFQEVLDSLKSQRMGNKKGQPYTKEELIASQVPGSVIMGFLSFMGWDEGMIGQFFEYAISATQYGAGFEGTKEQMNQVRGRSTAENQAELTTRETERQAKFAGQQYGTVLSQQDTEKKLVTILEKLDKTLENHYKVIGRLPTGWGQALSGLLSMPFKVAGAALGAAGGGDIGDPPGLSQLNPDVKGRISNMMAANPNLKVVSGRRTDADQARLRRSGNANIAAPGKSHHTRGAAADLGPPSQYNWIKQNAKKFGLDHAAGFGEPWHVQLAGTMFGIGDIDPEDKAAWQQSAGAFAQQVQWTRFMQEQAQGGTTGGAVGAIQSGVDTAAKNISDAVAAATSGVKGGGTLSWDDMAKVAYSAGFRGEALQKMIAIAGAESHGNTGACDNPVGKDNSYGLWQINMKGNLGPARLKQFGLTSNDQLYDPDTNAAAAFKVSGGGANLAPWSTYNNGAYKSYMDDAQTAMKDLGYGDIGARGGGGGGVSVSHTPISFNNTFHVSVSGNGSTDIDRMVRQVASKLEAQMQRIQATRR